MTKLLACLLGTFLSLHAGQAPVAADKPKDEKCSIEGRVVNSVTGEAVQRVSLMLMPASAASAADLNAGRRMVESDDNGRFAFRDLNPGRYTLLAQRTGFAAQAYGGMRNQSSVTPLVLSMGQQVKEVLLKLSPDAIVSGRVLDSEGGPPMGRVVVTALRPGYVRGERQWFFAMTAMTNDLGEFRIANLVAGSYIVAARLVLPPGSFGTSGKPDSEKPVMGYVMTYYPDSIDAAGAMSLQAVAGGETRLADMRLLTVPTVRVSGKLTGGSEGRPVNIRLIPQGAGTLGSLAVKTTTVQQSGGSFELDGVAAGTYVLSGTTSDPQAPLFGAMPVQVGQQNIEGLLLQLGATSDLPGVITVEGKSSANLDQTQVVLQPRDLAVPAAAGSIGPVGAVGQQGKFALKGVAGSRYLVQVKNGPEGSYVKSVRLGDQDVTEEGLDLTYGVAGSLQITLSPEAAQVDGVVRNADNQPVAGATVVLVPGSRRYSLYREERTDQNGAFSLKGVAPGDYKLLAWEDIETGAYQDPEFLKKYESKAESLSLKPSDRRAVQLKMIPFEDLP